MVIIGGINYNLLRYTVRRLYLSLPSLHQERKLRTILLEARNFLVLEGKEVPIFSYPSILEVYETDCVKDSARKT